MSEYNVIGKPTPLFDGHDKVVGRLRFAPDLKMSGVLIARLVTSDHAHANILQIHTEDALLQDGVVAVLTANDFPEIAPTGRQRLLLARERVQFVGHPIAIVVAETEAAAEDGAELVWADYEALPAAITIQQAIAENAPLVWPTGLPGRTDDAAAHGADVAAEAEDSPKVPSNIIDTSSYDRGDVESGFAAADIVVERSFSTSMVHQNYLETTGVIAQPDAATGGVTIWSSTQGPYVVRQDVAEVLGIRETDVRVIPTPVGGGFGGKFLLYEPLVALACRAVNRPVQLILSRYEELLTANPTPATEIWLKIGATQDGTLTALDADISGDGGLYPPGIAGFIGMMIGSPYRIPNIRIRAKDVLTFKPSTGAYRAPGAPQATFARETILDDIATQIGMDPIEFRLKNAVTQGDMMVYDRKWEHMAMREVLETLCNHPAWQDRQTAQGQKRGVGMAIGYWGGATGPGAATCSLERDGTLSVHVNSVDISGTRTTFALMAAEAFGIEAKDVNIVSTDTASGPYGAYTGGSRVTYVMGSAVAQAARDARQQALEIVAQEFEAAAEDLEIVDGKVQVKGFPNKTISLAEVAGKTMGFSGKYLPVQGTGRQNIRTQSPAFCAQLAEVEVDEETGVVEVKRLVVVQDAGRAINPLAVEGQMMGGATQGVGWALYEGLVYDENGQLLTGSWMDYAVPDANQTAPLIETVIVEIPSEHGPFGVRGVGEPPVIATAAAIANAIADATGAHPTDLPMTPPRILQALSKS
jgi:CO/xanthine dehydrogenase Mo-binding subunit